MEGFFHSVLRVVFSLVEDCAPYHLVLAIHSLPTSTSGPEGPSASVFKLNHLQIQHKPRKLQLTLLKPLTYR